MRKSSMIVNRDQWRGYTQTVVDEEDSGMQLGRKR